MDKINIKNKNNFTKLFGMVSKLYNEGNSNTSESYLIGKKEAYEEILNWFMTSHNGELKYISANSFLNMLQEKLTKTKSAIAQKNIDEIPLQEEEIKQFNFSDIKIADNRKRIGRFANTESLQVYHEPMNEESSVNFPISVGGLLNNIKNNSAKITQPSSNSSVNTVNNIFNSNNFINSNMNNINMLDTQQIQINCEQNNCFMPGELVRGKKKS